MFITNEEAINKIYSINDQFIILSDFKGWRDKITRKCKTCGDTRDVQANLLRIPYTEFKNIESILNKYLS